MQTTSRQILVTSALPYANGSIHIGHLVEYIQTDIWVRYQKMRGHCCYYVCADDAHGTPIMLSAQKQEITPEALIAAMSKEHQTDFADFAIGFDNYHSTHSAENRELTNEFYHRLNDGGYITKRTIKQAYDPEQNMFLPDRFIKGDCPKCGSADQYGDNCETCGATYSPTDLKNPVSAISGATPIEKESEHYFFKLDEFETMLRDWTGGDHLQDEITNKLDEWFKAGLQQWNISRDAPYFGFEIPAAPGKYFYVWLDAPLGYFASFKTLCARTNIDFDQWLKFNSTTELYHFIGKDIVYFHALFWPAILTACNFRKPTAIFVHGFLTVDGQKMSKSRGTFITARTYLNHLNPEYLRYYFAAKLNSSIEDIDLNLDDFINRVNADLIGKVVNIASRCAGFIQKRFAGKLVATMDDVSLFNALVADGDRIKTLYEDREYSKAMREIMALADQVNQYIDQHKPWVMAKQAGSDPALHTVCSMGINCFRLLILYLKPVLPITAKKAEAFLNIEPLQWQDIKIPLTDHTIKPFKPLLKRIEKEHVDKMITASKDDLTSKSPEPLTKNPIAAEIQIDDVMKVDLRVARIIQATYVEGADKLLQLTLDLGGEQRNVLAGIKSAYTPAELEGKLTVMVANLAPRKMRFGCSDGMLLAAGEGGKELFILSPDQGAKPGMRIS